MHQLNYGKIRIEDETAETTDAEKRKAQKRWEDYIAAMRGYLSSHPLDVNRVDAYIARMWSKERVWSG